MILDAIDAGTIPLAMDLILSLGLFFLIVNLLVEFSFPLIDPRLRMEPQEATKVDAQTWRSRLEDVQEMLCGWFDGIQGLFRRRNTLAPPVGTAAQSARPATGPRPSSPAWSLIQSSLRNPMFIASAVAMLLLAALALFGGKSGHCQSVSGTRRHRHQRKIHCTTLQTLGRLPLGHRSAWARYAIPGPGRCKVDAQPGILWNAGSLTCRRNSGDRGRLAARRLA